MLKYVQREIYYEIHFGKLLSSFFFSFFAKAVDLGDYNAGKNNVKEFLLSCPGFHHTVIFCVEMVLDF